MLAEARSLARAFLEPVPRDARASLDRAWARLPEPLRTPRQFLGRQYAGCGATIGAMPRCDFACRGCYLGEGANQAPPASLDEIRRQLRAIRGWLGTGGNVQLTDGEVTLRDADELVEICRYARAIGLVPMLMTHGDAFRRRPGLLPRLVAEGGLSEISLHVDTTQRGRRGDAYKDATREAELLPLRDELADLVRRVRRETRRTLDVATTFTVTRDNLAEVPLVLRWVRANADAFKMISFQPAASVGRTETGLGGRVSIEELWDAIARGALGDGARAGDMRDAEGWLGHPDCSRFVQGLVVRTRAGEAVFHPLLHAGDVRERESVLALMRVLGGLTLRLDGRARAAARLAGVALRAPLLLLRHVPRLVSTWMRRVSGDRPLDFARRWARGEVRVDYLNVVSHHFMSREEIASAAGRERLAVCVFRVPIGDRLVSMCEVNALGTRDRFYDELRSADRTPASGASVGRALGDGLELVREEHQTLAAVEFDRQ